MQNLPDGYEIIDRIWDDIFKRLALAESRIARYEKQLETVLAGGSIRYPNPPKRKSKRRAGLLLPKN